MLEVQILLPRPLTPCSAYIEIGVTGGFSFHCKVAQLAEQLPVKEKCVGSKPALAASNLKVSLCEAFRNL